MEEIKREWLEKVKEREEAMVLIDKILALGVSPEIIKAELEKTIKEVI